MEASWQGPLLTKILIESVAVGLWWAFELGFQESWSRGPKIVAPLNCFRGPFVSVVVVASWALSKWT
jgi:hypothetical protein